MTPFIYEKTKDGEIMYDIYSRLAKDRILFLTGAITEEVGSLFAATLLFLDCQDNTKPISLYLNSVGGMVHPGLFTILDTMNFIKSPIQTVNVGEAYSAAAVLLCNGTKGMRLAYENSQVMIHEIQAGTFGSYKEMEQDVTRMKKVNEKLIEIIAKAAGQDKKIIKDLCEKETYLSAQEALKLGLIDKIITKNSHSVADDLDFLDGDAFIEKSNKKKVKKTTRKR